MRVRLCLAFLFLSSTMFACGSEPTGPSGAPDLAMPPVGVEDLATAAVVDLRDAVDLTAASPMDLALPPSDGGPILGPVPDGGFCHTYGWGQPAVGFTKVTSLPTMTGGTIPAGAYDAVEVTTDTNLMGTLRSTWVFDATNVFVYEQLTLSGPPPTPIPRTYSWSTASTSLMRQPVCAATMSFTNSYRVRTEASGTYLDLRSGSFVFTYKKR